MSLSTLRAGAAIALTPVSAPNDLKALVKQDGYPAALSSVRDERGRVHNATAGVGDLKTRAPVPKELLKDK